MTEVLQSSTSHFPSPSSSFVKQQQHPHSINPTTPLFDEIDQVQAQEQDEQEESKRREREGDHVSIAELLVAAFRRSIVRCSITAATGRSTKELCKMEIGVPTDVRHVAHVTFDRFNGFLGLPVEFELEVPRRAPSASATVFGVSTASMQLSFDSRGNSVPTILLMMQRQLYTQGGLQAEGIFRITAGNSQEEYVRDQLNRGVVPEGIDVHCLAGLIKAWFRELPTGILDSLSPEQVMQSQSEEEFARLVSLLPATEAALLDWAINLMADVAQTEHLNKMNAHNIAMVFAPNMTQMSDPLTALMYVVQVMNFLKNLILRKLRERKESILQSNPIPHLEPSDGNGRPSSSQPSREDISDEDTNVLEGEKVFVPEEPAVESPRQSGEEDSVIESPQQSCEEDSASKTDPQKFLTSIENIPGGNLSLVDNCPGNIVSQVNTLVNEDLEDGITCRSEGIQIKNCKNKNGQSSNSNLKKGAKKEQKMAQAAGPMERSKATCILGSMNSRTELLEAWR